MGGQKLWRRKTDRESEKTKGVTGRLEMNWIRNRTEQSTRCLRAAAVTQRGRMEKREGEVARRREDDAERGRNSSDCAKRAERKKCKNQREYDTRMTREGKIEKQRYKRWRDFLKENELKKKKKKKRKRKLAEVWKVDERGRKIGLGAAKWTTRFDRFDRRPASLSLGQLRANPSYRKQQLANSKQNNTK